MAEAVGFGVPVGLVDGFGVDEPDGFGVAADVVSAGFGVAPLRSPTTIFTSLPVDPAFASTTPIPAVTSAASGAIAIPALSGAESVITYGGGNGAYTLAAPTAGAIGVGVIVPLAFIVVSNHAERSFGNWLIRVVRIEVLFWNRDERCAHGRESITIFLAFIPRPKG